VSRRTDRVEDLIRSELSQLILRELHDPRVRLATVSEVHVTPDLRKARIGVSVMGEPSTRDAAVAALQHASGFLRRQLGSRLRLRATPELLFTLDRGAEHSVHIASLLETLHHDDDQQDDEQDGT
jgi:ribosome-binding factor A